MPINYLISVTGDCQDTSSGAANIIITGATEPYTAAWVLPNLGTDDAVTATTRTGLSAGTYVVTVNDSSSPENEVININVQISGGICIDVNANGTSCDESNGSITATTTPNNASQVAYELFDQSGFVTSASTNTGFVIFNDLTPNIYQIFATDIGGCTGHSDSIIINNSQALDFGLFVVGNTSCFGPNGKIFVTGLTTSDAVTYQWSNGATSSSITGLTDGTYSVTITDTTLGCSATKAGTIVTIPPPGLGLLTAIPATCFDANGSITITVTGGTAPYYYSGSNGQSIISYLTTFTMTGLTNGLYSISVTDASLCNFTTSTALQGVNTFNVGSITTQNSFCSVDDGSITASIEGGSPLYTYTLVDSLGDTTIQSTNSTQFTFQNLSGGTYTLFITDNSGCIYSQEVTIITSNKFTVTPIVSGITCGHSNGSVILTLSSGGTSPYTYSLSNGNILQDTTLSSVTFTNLAGGQYTATVTDATNCSQVVNFVVLQENQPVQFNLFGINPTTGSTGGVINALITNGQPPFTLEWSSNVGAQSGLTVTGLTAGTYSLTIIDTNGCSLTRSIILNVQTVITTFQLFNICSSPFSIVNGAKTGIAQLAYEGFNDLTSGETGCVLNSIIFTTLIQVSGVTYQNTFFTGMTLNDIPSDDQFQQSIETLLSEIPGIGQFSIDILNNKITIFTNCNTGNQLASQVIDISLQVQYDITCEVAPTPTPVPTATPVPTPTSTALPAPTPTPSPTATSIPFEIFDAVVGYQISRYWYDYNINTVVDAGNNKIACWAAYQAIGQGEIQFILHDSNNILIDSFVGGLIVNNTTVGNGSDTFMETFPTNGYNQILVQTSTNGGATWTTVHTFPISTTLSEIQGTIINNGNTANSGTQAFNINEQFANAYEFGTAGNTADFAFNVFRVARLSGTPAGLPASGTLFPTGGMGIGGTFTGVLHFSAGTVSLSDQITLSIDYNITLNLNTGAFFFDISNSISLGLRALGVGTFLGNTGLFVQPVAST